MSRQRKLNEIIIREDHAAVVVESRKHGRREVLIDLEDVATVRGCTWYIYTDGHGINQRAYSVTRLPQTNGKARNIRMHNMITGVKGIDHKNHNGLDNRRVNLRVACAAWNNANRRKQFGTSSKFKGVSWHKRDEKWQARLTPTDRQISLGYFTSELEAAIVYDVAALEWFGPYAHTNKVPYVEDIFKQDM